MLSWTSTFLTWMLQTALAAGQEIRVYLVDQTLHNPDVSDAGDAVLADIPANARLTFGTVAGHSVANRVVNYTPFEPANGNGYPDPGTARKGRLLAHVLWTGDEATSPVMGYDTLPEDYILDGTDDRLEWPQGVGRLTLA